jgi:uncharacterized protein GlcG (DUF336 family)
MRVLIMIHANRNITPHRRTGLVLLGGAALLLSQSAFAQPGCFGLPSHSELESVLQDVVKAGDNGGLRNNMWASVVDRDGVVCNVVRSSDLGNQWPGSRVISAQKAYTGNAFSLPNGAGVNVAGGGADIALSSGNLYGTVLEQGSLFGLQFSNPVDTANAYSGNAMRYGTPQDPMKGRVVGGINVFGGGLALYDSGGNLVGGLGVSGDTSCTDHVVAWKVRDALGLDNVPGGVSATGDDNLNIVTPVTPGAFEHPDCGGGVAAIIADLPDDFPIGD